MAIHNDKGEHMTAWQGGIRFRAAEARAREHALTELRSRLDALGLWDEVAVDTSQAYLRLAPGGRAGSPEADTLGLCARLGLDPVADPEDAEREILLAMLAGPIDFAFDSYAQLASAVRVRRNIAAAARRTALSFDTSLAAERPADYWTYDRARGFTILPGRPLIDALRAATQPGPAGPLYAFSCYRASEYVIVLGMAEEMQACHPALLARLQRQWETRAIMSGEFHEVFLREYGSLDAPLPPRYYVPGDRVWFRNPDAHSSDVSGYEGSWVFYLGAGLFNNFWKRDQPYDLTGKCVEIYHWRDGFRPDGPQGRAWIDERIVDARTAATLADPAATARILERMLRIRDPQGVYDRGGCIDATREGPRSVHPDSVEVTLPDG